MKTKSDYYNLQTELYEIYSRKRYLLIFLVASIAVGIIVAIFGTQNNLPVINKIITGLFVAFSVFLILAISNVALVNMNQSDYEEKIVQGGIQYLSENRLSPKRIEIIGKRAEIGSNALSSRTILPVLTIPFLITFFSGKISSGTQLFIVGVIITIGMSFIVELDRANMDVLIRQICVSYIPSKIKEKKKEANLQKKS
jgi:hypothetical protein